MKMNRAKINVEVMDKVTGKQYRIMQVDELGSVAAYAINSETPEEVINDDCVVIDEKNALCFRVLRDPNPKEVPQGYTVESGILMKDGKQVTEQGQLKIVGIITAMPGKILLAVEPRVTAEGRADLFSYDPEKDKFNKLISVSIPRVSVFAKVSDDEVILKYSRTYEEPVKDEDGKDTAEKQTVFDAAAIMMYSAKSDRIVDDIRFDTPIEGKPTVVEDAGELLITVTKAVDEDTLVVSDAEESKIVVIDYDGPSLLVDTTYVGGEVLSATVVQIDDESLLIKTAEKLIYTNEEYTAREIESAAAMKQLDGFDYLVDAEIKQYEFTLTLANKQYEMKTVKSVSTKDRGIIVSVQDC